ncbi:MULTISPECIES: metallophosphoesterase family protein [unclassified Chryseobacterium]|uniref:metallophosphoesterase family protein n=1 Tax=unclassified Chryseobacterium TaxID=2593645 RepID=UPI00100A6BD3|nr:MULTISPECIES: metallophosphoesterase [unclassified Chryseobacterium]RXM50223.1 metallophosphatase family protein [Chryseobacterium sp. CH25]RXM62584.1 metallophosphatase family protein [Chryseobacterium sp. CH1]
MIQIAIFSDVHGNLPALEVVLKDIEKRGIHQMFCLGDLVDFAPWGNEVIEKIKNLNIPCLLGNHDERIAFDLPVIPLSKHSEEETKARFTAIDHSKKHITEENKKFLSELPFYLKLNYKIGNKHWNIQLVHSSLESNDTYLYESENDEVFMKMLERSNADLIVMGHTHLSFTKQFENNKWVVNCGSVGRSKEENRLASYLVLTLDDEKIIPEIVQLGYPLEETARQIEESEIPDYYAAFLRNEKVSML